MCQRLCISFFPPESISQKRQLFAKAISCSQSSTDLKAYLGLGEGHWGIAALWAQNLQIVRGTAQATKKNIQTLFFNLSLLAPFMEAEVVTTKATHHMIIYGPQPRTAPANTCTQQNQASNCTRKSLSTGKATVHGFDRNEETSTGHYSRMWLPTPFVPAECYLHQPRSLSSQASLTCPVSWHRLLALPTTSIMAYTYKQMAGGQVCTIPAQGLNLHLSIDHSFKRRSLQLASI